MMSATSRRDRLREITRQAVQAEISDTAMRLFMEQGYEQTTIEQVGAAVGMSGRSVSRYFATKEDMVLQDSYDPLIADAVRARPARESSLTAVRRGLADAFAGVYQGDVEAIRQRTALILSVPALKARSREQQDSLVTHLTSALADRNVRNDTDLEIEVAASSFAAVLEVAVGRWARDGGDLPSLVDAAFVALGRLTRRSYR